MGRGIGWWKGRRETGVQRWEELGGKREDILYNYYIQISNLYVTFIFIGVEGGVGRWSVKVQQIGGLPVRGDTHEDRLKEEFLRGR